MSEDAPTRWFVRRRRGHVTQLSYDEVAEDRYGAGWLAVCVTCDDVIPGYIPAAVIGYYQSEAEGNAARAKHVEEAGDR